MWDKRESNMMHRDQNMNFDFAGPEIPFMQSTRFPPPSNSLNGQFFLEASRKRKPMDMDPGHDGVSQRFLGSLGGQMSNLPQRDYTFQPNVPLPPPVDSPMLSNNNSGHANPRISQFQYEAFQFYNTDTSLTSETKDEDIKKASFGSLLPFHHKGPPFPVQTHQGISEYHDSKHLERDIVNQHEQSRFPSHYREHSGFTEMSQVALRLDDRETLRHGNNSIPCVPCPYPFNMPPNNMTTLGSSNLRAVDEIFHSDVGNSGQKISRYGPYEEKECGQVTRLEENRNISIAETHTTQTFAFGEGREAYNAYQYHDTEITGSSINNDNLGAPSSLREQSSQTASSMPGHTESFAKEGCLDRVPIGFETKTLERAEGLNTENTKHPSGEETSFSGNSLANRSVEPVDTLPPNLEERTQSAVGKVSPLIAEKLWDGSLQLSTSTTVSAVAFFKSGEKAQDTKWSEHVEIKGKVRLQAFEKFIQELPRSRNRALMVISLCWKPGSPVAGLAGMKEVAKGYRESQRVGFAQICPGYDLYVCPRSDTIITILAKYGFFKGMTALEDDQDSLIGCVIWRRGYTSSNSISKISEKKKTPLPDQQPLNSPEPSVPEIHSPITQLGDTESKQEKAPSPLISTLDSSRAITAESKVIQSTNNPSHGSGSFHINSVSELTPPLPYNSPFIQVQPPVAPKPESTFLQETMKDSEVPITQAAEPQKHDGGTAPVQPNLPGPPRMFQGVPQQTKPQFSNGLHNFNYNSCPPPQLGSPVSLNSPFIRPQILTTQNLDSCYPMQSNSKPYLAPLALPGPPLPPDILHRIIQFSRDANKAPTEGIPKADPSFMTTGEPNKPNMSPEPGQKSANLDDDDDDGDLPEFDFVSACGISKAPESIFPGYGHQTHLQVPPFNQQILIDGPIPPVVKNMDIMQTQQASGFPDTTLNTYQEPITILPSRFGELNSEKKPADVLSISQKFPGKANEGSSSSGSFSKKNRWDDDDDDMPEWLNTYQEPITILPSRFGELNSEKKPADVLTISQKFPGKANEGSSTSGNFSKKNRWDDDDDDMPEWCPPDMEHLDVPKPSTGTRVLPPVRRPASDGAKELPVIAPPFPVNLSCPPQSPSFSQGYHPGTLAPRSANPAPVHNNGSFVPIDFRPPRVPHPNHSMRPPAPNFGPKPPVSEGSWQWKRR